MNSYAVLFSPIYFGKLGGGGNDTEFDHTEVRVSSKDEAVPGCFRKQDARRQHGHNNFMLEKQSLKSTMSDLEDFYLQQEEEIRKIQVVQVNEDYIHGV